MLRAGCRCRNLKIVTIDLSLVYLSHYMYSSMSKFLSLLFLWRTEVWGQVSMRTLYILVASSVTGFLINGCMSFLLDMQHSID
jgi:uncharacterized membrane protein